MDVAFYEVFEEEKKVLRKFLPPHVKASFHADTAPLKPPKPPAKLISIRAHSRISPAWSRPLRGILTRSQGYDHLLAYRRATGFQGALGYLGDYCARAVAEHVLLSLMALWRKLEGQRSKFCTFDRDGLTGRELLGKNAGVIGVGRIGSETVKLLKAVGMAVRGVDVDPRLKSLEYVPLKAAVRWADVLVCALPLTEMTKGLLDYRLLRRAKKGCVLINIARGEIAPVADIERLLDGGFLGGAALDVFEEEGALAKDLRCGKGSAAKAVLRLSRRQNVLCTPHNAFNTEEALGRKARRSAEAVAFFLARGRFPHEIPSA